MAQPSVTNDLLRLSYYISLPRKGTEDLHVHNICNDECDHHEHPVPGLKARLVEANGQACGFDQQGNFDGSQRGAKRNQVQ